MANNVLKWINLQKAVLLISKDVFLITEAWINIVYTFRQSS